jgi:hypothetical protein
VDQRRILDEMVTRVSSALGERLVSLVLYGPSAHGDTYREVSQLHLMIVCADLEPETLGKLGDPVHWWLKHEQPWPRLFTPEMIRDSVDIYPIELLDITRHHRVLAGRDALASVQVDLTLLRLQCERELREKLMRLREGYVESRGKPKHLRQLLAASYSSFALVWRGCLHLFGGSVPAHDREVAAALCRRLELDPGPLEEVAQIAAGTAAGDEGAVFARYYRALGEMVARIDRLIVRSEKER